MSGDPVASSVSFRQFDSYADFPPASEMVLGALAWATNDNLPDLAGLYTVRQSSYTGNKYNGYYLIRGQP